VHSIVEIFKDQQQGQHYLHLQQPTTSCKDEKGQRLHLQKIENKLHRSITRTMPFAFANYRNNNTMSFCICKNQQVANIDNTTIFITFTRINKTTITFQGEV
jgi:hypothetical protein